MIMKRECMMKQYMSFTVLCIVILEWFSWQGHRNASLLGCSIMLNDNACEQLGFVCYISWEILADSFMGVDAVQSACCIMSLSIVAVMDVLVDAGFVCDKDVMLMGKMKVTHCSAPQRIVLHSQVTAVLNCCLHGHAVIRQTHF